MNDLYLLQSDLEYHLDKVRRQLQPLRRRRWERIRQARGPSGVTTEESWIS